MSKIILVRIWAMPLTIGAFLLVSATGILMFFGWERGLTSVVHEWSSWLFLAGACGHIADHARPFKNHLKSSCNKTSISIFVVVLAASSFSWGFITGPQLKRSVEQVLVDAPLSALASLTSAEPDALMRKLKVQGIIATSQQSIRDLSNQNGVSEHRLLGIVFLPE